MKFHVQTLIKKEIEHVFGRRIVSSRDCIQLSDEIYHKTKVQLNPNTLRRFFGLVKAEYATSYSTLTVLSRYCGFQSVDEVQQVKKELAPTVPEPDSVLNFLIGLFRDVQVPDRDDKTFLSLVMHTVNYLNRNHSLTDQFQVQIAKTRNGQDIYFEKFVNIDKLNGYYGDGLRYYYSEKRTDAAQVFARSLLVYRYWLTGETGRMESHIQYLLQHTFSDLVSPYFYGRYWAALLYQADHLGQPSDEIIQNAYRYYSSISPGDHAASFPRYELYMTEALVFTGHADEALYYIDQFKKGYSGKEDYNQWKFFQSFLLFEVVAYVKKGDFVKANEVFLQIIPTDFYFLRKSFSIILYLLLGQQLRKSGSRQVDQLDTLIEETGFLRLNSLF